MNSLQRYLLKEIIAAIVLTVIILVFAVLGVTTSANLFVKNSISPYVNQSPQANVHLIQFPINAPVETLSSKLTFLKNSQPAQMLFVLPDDESYRPLQQLANSMDIGVVKNLTDSVAISQLPEIKLKSQWAADKGYLLPTIVAGQTHQRVPLTWQDRTGTYDSFISKHIDPGSIDHVFINFFVSPLSVPMLHITDLATTEFNNKHISGKLVLLIPEQEEVSFWLATPFETLGAAVSSMQFQGIAWQAAVNDEYLLELSIILSVIYALIFAYLLLASLRHFPDKLAKLMLLMCFFVFAPVTWGAFYVFNYIPPILESWVAMVVIALHFYQQKRFENELLFAQLNEAMLLRLKDTILPQSFLEGETPWTKISSLVSQQLRLERSIFLDKVPNDHRLKEISALNCSLDDILEMRRDYTREPYKFAIEHRNVTKPSRPYFKELGENEEEYLVPLMYSTEVLGFWAMTITASPNLNRKKFFHNIDNFAGQIGVLLYHRHSKASAKEQGLLPVIKRWFFGSVRNKDLITNAQLLGRKIDFSQRLFENMQTATVVFDLFGQVLEINRSMEQLAESAKLPIFKLSALDLMHEVTGLSENIVRAKLRQIVLHHNQESIELPVTLDKEEYLLSIRPILSEESEMDDPDAPFRVQGLIYEFNAVASIRHKQQLEQSVLNHYFTNVKNHFSSIQMAHIQVERKSANPEVQIFTHMLQQELINAANLTRKTHDIIQKLNEKDDRKLVPFDVFNAVNESIEAVQDTAKEIVQVETRFPTFSILGLGEPQLFSNCVEVCIKALAEDSLPPKKVHILGKQIKREGKDIIYLRLSNLGYGLPKQYTEQLLSGVEGNQDNSMLSQLISLTKQLEEWGVKTRIGSRMGKGIRIRFIFEGVSFNE